MRHTFGMPLILPVLQLLLAQSSSRPEAFPSVTISLPANTPSETVQIRYHMIGPFGGYGGYSEPKAGLHSCQIIASAEGQAATAIKILVYATGCEIQTSDFLLKQNDALNENFVCNRLPNVTLSGQLPIELIRDRKT